MFKISSCVFCLLTVLSPNAVTLVWSYLIPFYGVTSYPIPFFPPSSLSLLFTSCHLPVGYSTFPVLAPELAAVSLSMDPSSNPYLKVNFSCTFLV